MQTLCHGLRRPFALPCLPIHAGIAIHAGALYMRHAAKMHAALSAAAHQRDKIYGKRGHKHGYGKQHCPQP